MRNFPFCLMKQHAKRVCWTSAGLLMLYEDGWPPAYYADLFCMIPPPEKVFKKKTRVVCLYRQHVVKIEGASFKTLPRLYGAMDGVTGHRGILGEAVNTLAANLLGIKSHKLCAIIFNPLTGAACSAYARIVDKKSAADVLRTASSDQLPLMVKNIIKELIVQIRHASYYHPDCHLGNIFTDSNARNIQIIDFERCTRANCTEDQLFVAMAAKLYRKPLDTLMTFPQYLKLLREVATEEKLAGGADHIVESMKTLTAITGSAQNAYRRKTTSGKEISVMTLLNKQHMGEVC